MARKMKSIYEYFSNYNVSQVDEMLSKLSVEERALITKRYGNDLHNSNFLSDFNDDDRYEFYSKLVPKMRRIIKRNTNNVVVSREISRDELEKKGPLAYPKKSVLLPYEEIVIPNSKNVSLAQLLDEGKTNREICEILKYDQKKLAEELLMLKNKGLMVSRSYYSDSSIKYSSIHTMQDLKIQKSMYQDKTIITTPFENKMKFLLISDLHFGNELERIDLIDRAYNYCIKQGINLILCGGDLVDGTYTKGTQKISDVYEQIEYFINNYPYDKNILTFSVAGDHDISVYNSSSLDLIEACNNYRHDIVIGGYNNMGINLKNDKIHIYHHVDNGTIRSTNAPIMLHGHSHKYSAEMNDNRLDITLPSLSNILQPMPTALELDVTFAAGYIANAVVKQVYFGTDDIVLGESTYDLNNYISETKTFIDNEEEFIEKESLDIPTVESNVPCRKLNRENRRLSQIEKFQQKYNGKY